MHQTYQAETDTWVTSRNVEIPVPEMEDDHLLNAHRMLREWERDDIGKAYRSEAYMDYVGKEEAEAFIRGLKEQIAAGIERLAGEIEKRGLEPKELRPVSWWTLEGKVVRVGMPKDEDEG